MSDVVLSVTGCTPSLHNIQVAVCLPISITPYMFFTL